jgi:hypothetical protein
VEGVLTGKTFLGAVVLAALAHAGAASAGLSQTLSISHNVACPQCALRVERLVVLGDDGANLIGPFTGLWLDSRKRMYAIAYDSRSLIVWDSAGRRIATVGSSGQGPGEMSGNILQLMLTPGDTLYVLDRSRKLSLFTPDYRFIRSVELQVASRDVALLADGRFIVGNVVRTSSGEGPPFHLLDASGRIERSFGDPRPQLLPSARHRSEPANFGVSPDRSSIWHWQSWRYQLTQWRSDGSRVMHLDVVQPPWYTAPPVGPVVRTPASREQVLDVLRRLRTPIDSEPPPPPDTEPPSSTLYLAGIDTAGRIWMFGSNPRSAGPQAAGPVMEIIDPARGTKLFSGTVQQGMWLLGNSGRLAWSTQSDTLQVRRITVWRLELVGR